MNAKIIDFAAAIAASATVFAERAGRDSAYADPDPSTTGGAGTDAAESRLSRAER